MSGYDDLLPDQTTDDTAAGWGDEPPGENPYDDSVRRYLAERPPHHGD